ncbi:PREDICTED: uncharacterized protein LOC109114375 [Nelumbo nucifera]|uniref:Uncharacterized protein LOC109114375 n=1 Tax=Nelumbo nucifera TaxID=4432 RepID=A0A1U8Q1E3_NELNU|nr:PREDICTED: uncharacterized protein LOC109114375 [Nelumbo nucifera]
MTGCKPSTLPMLQQQHLALALGPLLIGAAQYRRLVGRLVYLTITRPGITFVVNVLTQFMSAPWQDHWDVAIHVLRYLKNTVSHGILLSATSNLILKAYCDSDWAGCPVSRRSTTGYITMLGASPLSWKPKKQTTVSRSSAVEYRAMIASTSEPLWLK